MYKSFIKKKKPVKGGQLKYDYQKAISQLNQFKKDSLTCNNLELVSNGLSCLSRLVFFYPTNNFTYYIYYTITNFNLKNKLVVIIIIIY